MNPFMRRIETLKNKLHAKNIVAIWRFPDGTEAELSVDEGIAAVAEFIRVVDGSSIEDAEKILDYVTPDCVI